MNNNILLIDSREKKFKHITDYFDKINQEYIITKLETADYMFYKNYNVVIDRKMGLIEVASNLCNSVSHLRVVREIERAKELNVKRFIFLIEEPKITCIDDVENWSSKYSKVKGSTLKKILLTMSEKYKIEFLFCPKKDMGKKIIELLKKEGE